MSKNIIICADDYAQNEAISEGILSLAQMQRINAISSLVNANHWTDFAQELNQVKQNCFIGLHLNLTFGQALSSKWRKQVGEHFTGLPYLLSKIYFKRLNLEVVKAEIEAQIDVFTNTMHVYPDFIDGHQHIHQMPIIRQALLEIYMKQKQLINHYPDDDPDEPLHLFFRSTSNGWRDLFSITSFPKSQLIAILGGHRFKQLLFKRQILTNTSFSGIYNFKNAAHYRKYFQRFLTQTRDGGVIMCHPGYQSNDVTDPQYQHRHHELNYLKSDEFLNDLEDNSLQLLNKY